MQAISLRLPREFYDSLKEDAKNRDLSLNRYIYILLQRGQDVERVLTKQMEDAYQNIINDVKNNITKRGDTR